MKRNSTSEAFTGNDILEEVGIAFWKRHSMHLSLLVFPLAQNVRRKVSLFYIAFISIISTFEYQKMKASYRGLFPTDHTSLIIQFTEHWLFILLVCTFIPAVIYTIPLWNLYSKAASTFSAVISSRWCLHSMLLQADGEVCWLRGDGDLVLELTGDIGLGVREADICGFLHNAFLMEPFFIAKNTEYHMNSIWKNRNKHICI